MNKEQIEEVIDVLGEHRIHPNDRIRDAKDKLRAMIEPLPESEWVECEPSEATHIEVNGVYTEVSGDSYHTSVLSHIWTVSLLTALGVTFWRKKPSEPVVVEKTFESLHDAYTFIGGQTPISLGIVNNKPFTLRIEQDASNDH